MEILVLCRKAAEHCQISSLLQSPPARTDIWNCCVVGTPVADVLLSCCPSDRGRVLIDQFYALRVTLSLNTEIQASCLTIHQVIMHHHKNTDYEIFSSSRQNAGKMAGWTPGHCWLQSNLLPFYFTTRAKNRNTLTWHWETVHQAVYFHTWPR